MGTRIKPAIPLEIGKRNRKTWKTSPSQCVAILGESDEIKEKAFQLVKEIIEEKGFIAIWFYQIQQRIPPLLQAAGMNLP